MKHIVKQTLIGGCIIFTVAMAIWTCMGFIFAGPEYGLVITATLLIACIALAILQSLWFTNRVLKRTAYPLRVLGFGLAAFAVLALCAYVGDWVPRDNAAAWVSFVVIYLIVLAVMTAGYSLYYRKISRDLDKALSRYRSEQQQ